MALKDLSELIRQMDNKARELEKAVLENNKRKIAKIKEEILALQKKTASEISKLKKT